MGRWGSGSEAQEHLLDSHWTNIEAPKLKQKARESPRSNQIMESELFRLGSFGPQLEPPQSRMQNSLDDTRNSQRQGAQSIFLFLLTPSLETFRSY